VAGRSGDGVPCVCYEASVASAVLLESDYVATEHESLLAEYRSDLLAGLELVPTGSGGFVVLAFPSVVFVLPSLNTSGEAAMMRSCMESR